MEFELISEKPVRFNYNVERNLNSVTLRSSSLNSKPLALKLVTGGTPSTAECLPADGGTPLDTHFRETLMNLLVKNCAEDDSTSIPANPLKLYWNITLTMTSSKTGSLKISTSEPCDIFKGLQSTLPENSFEFNLILKGFHDVKAGENSTQFQFEGKDLKLVTLPDGIAGIEMAIVGFPEQMWDSWKSIKSVFDGEITLTLRLDAPAVSKLYLEGAAKNQFTQWSRTLLREGTVSDLVIMVGGSKDKEMGLKCHKCILSGRSPVFKAMFQAEMSESRDNCVEIEEMTEVGVKALLQFIYGWDVEEASKDCGMALELLKAGDKYQMGDLEDAMTQLICAMPCQWFSVDVAVKLMLYAMSVDGKLGKVEKKCLAVLKWHAHTSTENLLASKEYQKLIRENPQTTMILGALLLKMI